MPTNLKNQPIFLVRVATTEIWLSIYWSENWVLCKVQYFRRLRINFQLYFILIYLKIIKNAECLQYLHELTTTRQKKTNKKNPKKQNMVMKTYKELLGTCIKSKKTAYINTVCTKSASKDYSNCFAIFGSSACQGQHAFSMSVLTCTAPWSSHTNDQELI